MNSKSSVIIDNCKKLIEMYEKGVFGDDAPTESIAPHFISNEERLVYYTLPMSLNYRRPSIQLWNAAKASYLDPATSGCYDLDLVAGLTLESPELAEMLSCHKLSLQPTRHPVIWYKIAKVIASEWGSIEALLDFVEYDFLKLRELVQVKYKKSFPYLSGPKLFNFWCYILGIYCTIDFKNKQYIDIAVDSHIKRASKILGLISENEFDHIDAVEIARRWQTTLEDSGIAPVDLNVPLWFWSRSGFTDLALLSLELDVS